MKTNILFLCCSGIILLLFVTANTFTDQKVVNNGVEQVNGSEENTKKLHAKFEQKLERIQRTVKDSMFHTHYILNLSEDKGNLGSILKKKGDKGNLLLDIQTKVYGTSTFHPTLKTARFVKCDPDTVFTFIGIESKIKNSIFKPAELECGCKDSVWDVTIGTKIFFERGSGNVSAPLTGGLAIILETQDPTVCKNYSPEIQSCFLNTESGSDNLPFDTNYTREPCVKLEISSPVHGTCPPTSANQMQQPGTPVSSRNDHPAID